MTNDKARMIARLHQGLKDVSEKNPYLEHHIILTLKYSAANMHYVLVVREARWDAPGQLVTVDSITNVDTNEALPPGDYVYTTLEMDRNTFYMGLRSTQTVETLVNECLSVVGKLTGELRQKIIALEDNVGKLQKQVNNVRRVAGC